MIEWILIVCIAATGWGCGYHSVTSFETKEDCFEALEHIRIINAGDKHTVAWCKPNIEVAKPSAIGKPSPADEGGEK